MKMIGLYLMGRKGEYTLKNILKYKNLIKYVVIGKDDKILNDYSEEIKKICSDNEINYYFREDKIELPDVDYNFCISWRWIIHKTKNLIVFHDSLLPKYRGFAPLVNMLINGENIVGVTAIFASNEYDKGEIIEQKKLEISYPKKIGDLIEEISILYAEIMTDILKILERDKKLCSREQLEEYATYSIWRDEKDYFIDWEKSSDYIKRSIDALGYPYTGAKTTVNGDIIEILEAEIENDVIVESREEHIGKVIFIKNGFPVIICGKGMLKITKAQYENSHNSIFPLKKFRSRFI